MKSQQKSGGTRLHDWIPRESVVGEIIFSDVAEVCAYAGARLDGDLCLVASIHCMRPRGDHMFRKFTNRVKFE